MTLNGWQLLCFNMAQNRPCVSVWFAAFCFKGARWQVLFYKIDGEVNYKVRCFSLSLTGTVTIYRLLLLMNKTHIFAQSLTTVTLENFKEWSGSVLSKWSLHVRVTLLRSVCMHVFVSSMSCSFEKAACYFLFFWQSCQSHESSEAIGKSVAVTPNQFGVQPFTQLFHTPGRDLSLQRRT